MKTRKLNLDDFMGCELPSNQKMYVRGGDPTSPPELEEDGGPRPGSTSNGDVKDPPPPPIFITAFID